MIRFSAMVSLLLVLAALAGGQDIPIPKHRARQIADAAPDRPRVKPKKTRRVLIWNTPDHLLARDPHKGYCTPYGCQAMKTLGTKTGAYTPVAGNDVSLLLPESIRRFDAIILNNACGAWITPSDAAAEKRKTLGDKQAVEAALRKSFTDWLTGGGGVVAYHYALGANRHWPQFHQMMGGAIAGHPWNEEIGIQVEEPSHPLVAAFGGKGFRLADEIFQYRPPWDRTKCRVLLSIDTDATNMRVKNYRLREDRDFALAWVRKVGKGRVFYTTMGHRTEIYWNPRMLRFYLDGIQFACGDLDAPADPRPADAAKPSRAPKPGPPAARQ